MARVTGTPAAPARAAALGLLLHAARAAGLDSCASRRSFTSWRCPTGTTFACWSSEPYAPWACWSKDQVGRWASHRSTADPTCRRWPTPPGSGAPYYDGACSYLPAAPGPSPAPPAVPLAWDAAYERAEATLARMQDHEKYTLMTGLGWSNYVLGKWWYVGNTAPVPRLGLPSLNMQDAAAGFRTYWSELVGSVTCWPSLLSLAATWDSGLVQTFAVALGSEFAGKGANGILGPSVNVHRVATNGRSFEYLSGEDPYLGSRLAEAYVTGVQSQGVFAVVKHCFFNEQETNRNSESSNVDEKTAWELYFPPFQAAVEAGVSAAMCSYNRVDGLYSCSNKKQMTHNLKEQMGFRGFVQSDWWAMDSTSLAQGLDQEMPGSRYFSPTLLAAEGRKDVDEAVKRILAVMYRMDLPASTKCSPPNCREWFLRNVTGPAHASLAHAIAAESAVLLKNRGGLLPVSLSTAARVAVIGSASVAPAYNPNGAGQGQGGEWFSGDYYAGGGSGHVAAGYAVTPLDGIRRRAAVAGIQVVASPTDGLSEAIAAARDADVSVIVAATTSGETRDRPDLHLDGGADELIRAVAETGSPTVVLVQAPGAVVMPWRDSVAAILIMFLGGQETGSAWADVLFGVHAPTGRLPLMIPESEADAIRPGVGPQVDYAEGMATSYRSKVFKAAFPFGHGLTYTTFEYRKLEIGPCDGYAVCVRVEVENTGGTAARTVAQLYVELPASAGHPAPLLKGFQKTGLLRPGAKERVTFGLRERDISYYHVAYWRSSWVKAAAFVAHVGESSADIRQSREYAVPRGVHWWQALLLLALALGLALLGHYCYRTTAWKRAGVDDLAQRVLSRCREGTLSSMLKANFHKVQAKLAEAAAGFETRKGFYQHMMVPCEQPGESEMG